MAWPPADPERRRERAHRVLDAAAELILRRGYDKTTIADVARAAGVAKGTIYLHWKTRELLFAALLRRERVATLEEVRRAEPGTLRELAGVAGVAAAEIMRRPLMRAVLLADTAHRALGAGREPSPREARAVAEAVRAYVEQAAGLAGRKLEFALEGQLP
ncbi:helix-turn-helix domain-containing protein [Nonomuraea sp. NPDC050547]|uniref:helix-turn-helix domain-containing protein n=1 Tax=Nonomuraea sp. NPDC050547 TaxID=3364368 RepID=UPI003788D1BA